MNAMEQAWQALADHKMAFGATSMRALFKDDASRFERFSLHLDDMLVDFSKNRITDETVRLLAALARR
jgi:glucose-6-phosphate isomerase